MTLQRCLFHYGLKQLLLYSEVVSGWSVITYVSALCPYTDINECSEADINNEDICGKNGVCNNVNGSFWCQCGKGHTNYGNERTPCSG